jgi:hypothetical protein
MSAGPAERRGWWIVPLCAAGAVIALACYVTFIDPRPYYVTEIDAEQDYYYNAKLILSGLPTTVHHPGTPVQYLASMLLAINGQGLEVVQRFFNSAYLTIAVLTALALLAFGALVGRRSSAGMMAIAFALILAWPSVLTYLTFLGADSFIVAVGIPTLALFWRSLERRERPEYPLLVLGGAGIGVCLAVKMSFVPVAVALLAGYATRAIRSAQGRPLAVVGAGAFAGYLIAIAPVLDRVGVIWFRTASRPDVVPAGGSLRAEWSSSMGLLAERAPGWLLLFGAAFVVVIALLVRRGAFRPVVRDPTTPADFDFVAGVVFLGLMLLGFGYTAAAATTITPGAEAGIRLRNITPSVLMAPFLVLIAERLTADRPRGRASPPFRELLLVGVGALAVLWSFSGFLRARRDFVEQHRRRIAITEARLASLAPTGRIAYWTESSQDYLGEPAFHFWGSYRYANQAYDGLLLRWFPRYTLLRLRNMGRTYQQATASESTSSSSRYGRLGDLYWRIRKSLTTDRPHYSSFPGLLAGEGTTGPITAVAFPEEELNEIQDMGEGELVARLHRALGVLPPSRENVAGVSWLLFKTEAGSP